MFTQHIHTKVYLTVLALFLLLLAGCASASATKLTTISTPTSVPSTSTPALTSPTPIPQPTKTLAAGIQDTLIKITTPREGDILSDKVTIQGSVTHPNFMAYGIVYAPDKYHSDNTAWHLDNPITWNVKDTVTDGVLGTWDTTQYPDGSYSLLLVVYEVGVDKPQTYFVDNLTVQNGVKATPTPVPPSPTPLPLSTPTGLESLDSFILGSYVLQPTEHLDTMRYAGMTWVMLNTQYPDTVEQELQTYHDAGFKVIVTAYGDARMPLSESFITDYTQWVTELTALGADAIEVWSEPNIERTWSEGSIDPEAYTQLLCEAYSAIKTADPQTLVISAAPAPTSWFKGCSPDGCDDQPWLERIYAAGAAQCMDYIGAHHNAGATSPTARIGHPADPQSDHHSWYFLPQTELYYQIFEGSHQVFYTALGYASQSGVTPFSRQFTWAKGTTDEDQAAWLAETVQLSLDSDMVYGIMVWNLDFHRRYNLDPQDGYALIRPDGSCPACVTLHEVLSR